MTFAWVLLYHSNSNMYTVFTTKKALFLHLPRAVPVASVVLAHLLIDPFYFQKCPDLVDELYGHPYRTLKTLLSPGLIWKSCGEMILSTDSGVRPPELGLQLSHILAVQVGQVTSPLCACISL